MNQTAKVLVVESTDGLREQIATALNDAGYQVSTDYRDGMKAVLDFEPDAVSWIAPLGKALLASQLGDRITLEDGRTVKIVKIE